MYCKRFALTLSCMHLLFDLAFFVTIVRRLTQH